MKTCKLLKILLHLVNTSAPHSKHLQATNLSFVAINKPLSNKTGEVFFEGLKRLCKLLEIDGQKEFF